MQQPKPIALTDNQLDQIMQSAAVLHPQMRRVFVEHVAFALRGKVIGDGEVFRACREVLRESGIFSPPTYLPKFPRSAALSIFR